MTKKYDFAGWVTKNDIRCSDGVTIKHDSFRDDNGKTVPLVWQHDHKTPDNILGHVELENRPEGVYGYGYFNESMMAESAKESVRHGDISAMSIFATKIKKRGTDVIHGKIREVSLVLSGANPGALIEHVNLAHDESGEYEEFVLYPGIDEIEHTEGGERMENDPLEKALDYFDDEIEHAESAAGKTIGSVMETLSDMQLDAVAQLITNMITEGVGDPALAQSEETTNEEDTTVKHSVFNNEGTTLKHGEVLTDEGTVLSHSDINEMFGDAITNKSTLKESMISHGITNIEQLFPDAHNVNVQPIWYKDQNTNTQAILSRISKSPFARIKSRYANLTEAEARAKGYIKGKEKKEQFFSLASRETTPQTIYKKQKLDRDDVIDITDFDVVSWMNTEMRFMLDEEIARATLIGDGRDVASDDKINETKIRPIVSDDDLYSLKATFADPADFVASVIKAKKDYRGSGSPVIVLSPTLMSELRLLKDTMGRYIYDNDTQIAARMGVSGFLESSFMDELETQTAILVNLSDYTLGSSKGGQVTTFDDFDIDFNQMKYLIETRLSGALTTPHSAIVLTLAAAEPEVPPVG